MMDMIFSWICDGIAAALNAAVEFLLPLIGFDQTRFITTFPWAGLAYMVLQNFALGAILLIGAISLIAALWGGRNNKIPPLRILLSGAVAVFLVYFGNYFLEVLLRLCASPYDVLLNLNATNGLDLDFNLVVGVLHSTFAVVSVFLYLFLLILIGVAFLKLILEVVERYLMLFVLMYLSPVLGWAPAASPYTSGITKKFFAMFISQCLILMLNVWSLKMAISMFANVTAGGTDPALSLLMGYALLRISSRMDNYINQLGFNAAITGAGLGGEILTAGMSIAKMGQQAASGRGGSSGGGSPDAGGVVGLAQKLAYGVKQVSPAAMFGEFAGGQAKSFGQAAADAVRDFHSAYRDGDNVQEAFSHAKESFGKNLSRHSHDAALDTQDKIAVANKLFGSSSIPYPPAQPPVMPKKPEGINGNPPTAAQWKQYNDAMSVYTDAKNRRENYVRDVANHGSRTAEMWNLSTSNDFPLDNSRDAPDKELLSATLMGTGLVNAAPKEAALLTAVLSDQYDSGEIEQVSFDQNGFQATYKQGNNRWTVNGLNQDQYDALDFSAQAAFQVRSTANDGNHYYYRFESSPLAAGEGKGGKKEKGPRGKKQ